MKVIDLLNKIANDEEIPKKIKFDNRFYIFDKAKDNYYENETCSINWDYVSLHCLNEEVEILEDKEDKDIPLISELIGIYNPFDDDHIIDKQLNYNFKELQKKINQVVEEFNKYRREHNE